MFVVKGWHFTEFALLQILISRCIELFAGRKSPRLVLLAAVICIAYAASDEWHQTFVPDRYGTTWDVLIDSLGVTMIAWIQIRRRQHLNVPGLEGGGES